MRARRIVSGMPMNSKLDTRPRPGTFFRFPFSINPLTNFSQQQLLCNSFHFHFLSLSLYLKFEEIDESRRIIVQKTLIKRFLSGQHKNSLSLRVTVYRGLRQRTQSKQSRQSVSSDFRYYKSSAQIPLLVFENRGAKQGYRRLDSTPLTSPPLPPSIVPVIGRKDGSFFSPPSSFSFFLFFCLFSDGPRRLEV